MKKSVVKGVSLGAEVAPFAARMDAFNDHRESLQRLQDTWEQLGLLGQIAGTGADISETSEDFKALGATLLESLARRLLKDSLKTLLTKAQTAVDILVRNLFERTADIGFLATDAPLRRFAQAAREREPNPAERAALSGTSPPTSPSTRCMTT